MRLGPSGFGPVVFGMTGRAESRLLFRLAVERCVVRRDFPTALAGRQDQARTGDGLMPAAADQAAVSIAF
jgi:hypothetical protein